MSDYSIVFNIWKRSTDLLARSLYCWQNQSHPPLEIIVVDLNPDQDEVVNVGKVLYHFSLAKHIIRPLSSFNLSQGQNIGIRNTSPSADYILCTGLELMFSQDYLEKLDRIVSSNGVAVGVCGLLEQHVQVSLSPFDEWEQLVNSVEPTGHNQISPGALQCASRDWWFKIQGYDERIPFTYSDSDILRRAWLDKKGQHGLRWHEAQIIHQWHERWSGKPFAGRGIDEIQRDMTITRNLNGWGQ